MSFDGNPAEFRKGARAVESNQESLHKDLHGIVLKYARTQYLRPFADHTREAFDEAARFVETYYKSRQNCNNAAGHDGGSATDCSDGAAGNVPFDVILDSGCGTGESTVHLARRFPGIPVIGIDKSAVRLTKAGNPHQTGDSPVPANAFWVRAELLDFWRLALDFVKGGKWRVAHHALYYPNPWPKQGEATRRFHLHPIFPTLMGLGATLELRTNWEIYAREFAEAVRTIGGVATCEAFFPESPETAFERKYKEAHQQLWRVIKSEPSV